MKSPGINRARSFGFLGGGVMVDAFPIGRLLGPNLTGGAGGRTRTYTAADWDRAVRHGILPDGRPSVMPAEDYRLMSDQELADVERRAALAAESEPKWQAWLAERFGAQDG